MHTKYVHRYEIKNMYQVSIHVCGLELIVQYCGRYCRANPRLLGVIVYWNCAIWRFFCPIYRLVTSKEKLPHHDTMVFHAIFQLLWWGTRRRRFISILVLLIYQWLWGLSVSWKRQWFILFIYITGTKGIEEELFLSWKCYPFLCRQHCNFSWVCKWFIVYKYCNIYH